MYLSTEKTIAEYYENETNKTEFPTFYDYCLYLCGGDFTAFDDYNNLARYLHQYDLNKGIPLF